MTLGGQGSTMAARLIAFMDPGVSAAYNGQGRLIMADPGDSMLRALSLLFCSVLLAVLSGCGGGDRPPDKASSVAFVTADPQRMFSTASCASVCPDDNDGVEIPDSRAAASAEASAASADIAREIEEADLYRVSGDLVFLLNPHRGLVIADLGRMELRGRLPFVGIPKEMYVRDTRAFVFIGRGDGTSALLDIDLSNADDLQLSGTLTFDGWISATRLVGDVIYAVAGGKVLSFSVSAAAAAVDSVTLPFDFGFVQTTDQFLAVAGPEDLQTRIVLVDISDAAGALSMKGSLLVPGYVADEYKLHIGAGTLRVVTHDWNNGDLSQLFMIDVADLSNPAIIGTLEIERGEQLFATRFTDEEAFIVTFERVDPLWIIDLRDPTNPKKAGELTVPGWSTHLVPVGSKLVALGLDPNDGWTVIVSLFDVSDPAQPSLLDRIDFGAGWSSAFEDVKAFGVFPEEGLVLVPVSGEKNELEVIDLGESTLTPRGSIETSGPVQRGFPHARGLCALTPEELVLVKNDSTLETIGEITIAEMITAGERLSDGRLVQLALHDGFARLALYDGGARLSDTELRPLSPDGLYVNGLHAAVTGWEVDRRAAYIVDFSVDPPVASPRIDLGEAFSPVFTSVGAPLAGVADASWLPVRYMTDALLSASGKLIVRTTPPSGPGIDIGQGDVVDGFAIVDLAAKKFDAWIRVHGGYITGSAIDGETLVFTHGHDAGADANSLPLAQHDLYRIDLGTHAVSAGISVPGSVVQVSGNLIFTIEQQWRDDFSYLSRVVASRLAEEGVSVLSTLDLPDGAYDLRAAGPTLYFTASDGGVIADDGSGGGVVEGETGEGEVIGSDGTVVTGWLSTAIDGSVIPELLVNSIRTIRLGTSLAFGPTIETSSSFISLLLPESASALILRDGIIVERWSISSDATQQDWSRELGSYPIDARADSTPGHYWMALGYAGLEELP